jgi:uncharacterized protein (DUF2336 family)
MHLLGLETLMPARSIIAELEDAVGGHQSDRRVETLRRVTDLFVATSGGLQQEHVAVFDDVLAKLCDGIEAGARAELSKRLAPIANAPTDTVKSLSLDNDVEVAAPVLSQSARLGDDDLIKVISTKSQDHLLAISTRDRLDEAVTDVLVDRGNAQVVRSVAKNTGAQFSKAGFDTLVKRSGGDDQLAELVGLRRDLPKNQFAQLFKLASEMVRQKLTSANPERVADISRVLAAWAAKASGPAQEPPRDYAAAKMTAQRLHAARSLDEAVIFDFAKQKKFEETVASLAVLCGFSVEMVEGILFGDNSELLLILAKSLELSWDTTKHILRLCLDSKQLAPASLETLQANFGKLQVATAQRVVRFYKVRQTAAGAASY